jgi:hypothetical protein
VSFQQVHRIEKFPRDEHVEIHVRTVTLNADAPPSAHVPVIEIREYLKEPELYGHGIVIPLTAVKDLLVAIKRLDQPVDA